MDEYLILLGEFKLVGDRLEKLILKFPKDKREKLIFDKWSLKNVVSHLSHWMIHDINCLESLIQEKEPYWEPDVEEFNKVGVEERKNKSWDEVYSEFVDLKKKLIGLYSNLPTRLRKKKFWLDKNDTPSEFLREDIKHWKDEHVPQLENYFRE